MEAKKKLITNLGVLATLQIHGLEAKLSVIKNSDLNKSNDVAIILE